jgi:hypothetical protein
MPQSHSTEGNAATSSIKYSLLFSGFGKESDKYPIERTINTVTDQCKKSCDILLHQGANV